MVDVIEIIGGSYMAVEQDDRYTRKDWYTCSNCHHVNVVNISKNPKFKKKQRMIWADDATWNTFKGLAGEFGYDHGRMLGFLIGILQREKITYDTAV